MGKMQCLQTSRLINELPTAQSPEVMNWMGSLKRPRDDGQTALILSSLYAVDLAWRET
jgi:hypothetical protein